MEHNFYYTNERNVQIVIALLKAHNIRRVIASPGTTNMTFVVSLQNDPWFQLWSSADERSAAYLACGMAAETGEPVVISCTGATASRNYIPGLTEAYYRKLPVLAVTSTRGNHRVGHLVDQQIDRRTVSNDIAVESVTIPMVKDATDERYCEIEANKAILALSLNGGGPSHINLYTQYSKDFSVQTLPAANAIFRYTSQCKNLPLIPQDGRIAIFMGSHSDCSSALCHAIDAFCATYDAVVFCDHTSGYRGKYEVHPQILFGQKNYVSPLRHINLCIHIGEVSGSQYLFQANNIWRVSPDGQLRDTWGILRNVFMMEEEVFFNHYSKSGGSHTEYLDALNREIDKISENIPELPFSNVWIAQQTHLRIPQESGLHLGIYNSLRSWNFFKLPPDIYPKCNVGGFGIDGGISALIGASIALPHKVFYGIFGDLAFFYDMNVIGNRHVGSNLRIMLINNGKGTEFRNYDHPCYFLGEAAEEYVAASGHYGNKSRALVKNYATGLGYEYLSASNKEEFLGNIDKFINGGPTTNPILFEVFTDSEDESCALEKILNIVDQEELSVFEKMKEKVKDATKKVVGENRVKGFKMILGNRE